MRDGSERYWLHTIGRQFSATGLLFITYNQYPLASLNSTSTFKSQKQFRYMAEHEKIGQEANIHCLQYHTIEIEAGVARPLASEENCLFRLLMVINPLQ
jgi:hypothetical protein